jgi:hypothetical protein
LAHSSCSQSIPAHVRVGAAGVDEDGGGIVERALSLIMAMTDQQRAQFFAKYTELSAARLPARSTNAAD